MMGTPRREVRSRRCSRGWVFRPRRPRERPRGLADSLRGAVNVQQPTQPDQRPATPQVAGIAWCAWHQAYSNTTRLVRDTSGARLFACYSCREAYDLAPVADQ